MLKPTTTNYNCPLYPLILTVEFLMNEFPETFGHYFVEEGLGRWRGNTNEFFIIDNTSDESAPAFQEMIKTNEFRQKVRNNIAQFSTELLDFSSQLFQNPLQDKSPAELANLYNEFNKRYKQLYLWGWVPNAVDGHSGLFTESVQSNFSRFMTERNLEVKSGEYFSLLTSYPELSQRDEARLELLGIAQTLTQNPEMKKLFTQPIDTIAQDLPNHSDAKQKIANYCRTYGWLTFNYGGPAYSLENCLDDLADLIKKGEAAIKEEINHLRNQPKIISQKRAELTTDLKIPATLQQDINLLAELLRLKDFRKNVLFQANYHVQALLTEIAHRLNYPSELIRYVFPDEMESLLTGKLDKDKFISILRERSQTLLILFTPGKTKIITQAEANAFLERFEASQTPEQITTTDQLKGLTACAGKSQGIVRIINDQKDIGKINYGEILISLKTDPSLLPAMKKASAIVTEQGGITSHAAIVSRELKTPCIVGVKNITSLVKDGDEIIVDASLGQIQIIR